jgi:hypothetical protein
MYLSLRNKRFECKQRNDGSRIMSVTSLGRTVAVATRVALTQECGRLEGKSEDVKH